MPIRKNDFISSEFALADPVPFTFAIRIVKSLFVGPVLMPGLIISVI